MFLNDPKPLTGSLEGQLDISTWQWSKSCEVTKIQTRFHDNVEVKNICDQNFDLGILGHNSSQVTNIWSSSTEIKSKSHVSNQVLIYRQT